MKRITMTKNDDLTIEQAFELFIRKATVRKLSQNTLRVYGYHFETFCNYVSREDLISNVQGKPLITSSCTSKKILLQMMLLSTPT